MADEMVPEAWFRQDVASTDGHRYHVATGFATARWRDAMHEQFGVDDDACCRAFVVQLLRVFARRSAQDSDVVAPYCGGVVYDWTRDAPFVGMAYSSPSFRSSGLSATQHYEALASPDADVARFWSESFHCLITIFKLIHINDAGLVSMQRGHEPA